MKEDGSIIVECVACGGKDVYSNIGDSGKEGYMNLKEPDQKCGCQKGHTMKWNTENVDPGVGVVKEEVQ